MEQPNVTGDGDAALTPLFWPMVALTGVATGLFGDFLMWILFGIQHFAFAYHSGELQTAVEHASKVRRVLSLTVAGVFVPAYHFTMTLLVWALLVGAVVGLISSGYIRLIGWVSHHRASGPKLLITLPVALTALGFIGIAYPQLFGNRKDMAHSVSLGEDGLGLLLALFVLKPLVTALCLGSGAAGGLFTPPLSTGAVLSGFLGLAWTHLWSGSPVGAFAKVGAASMIGASMQAPLTALALVFELTRSGFQLMVPLIAATVTATAVARHIDGYSVYSARLATAPATA